MSVIARRIILISAHYLNLNEFCFTRFVLGIHNGGINIIQTSSNSDYRSYTRDITLLLISGYGVISKKLDDSSSNDIIDKISEDTETFCHCIIGEGERSRINFIRNSQIQDLKKKLNESRISVCDIKLVQGKDIPENEMIVHLALEFVKQSLVIRNLIKPGVRNSAIAYSLYKKIRMSVLSAIVILLLINVFVKDSISKKNSALAIEVSKIQKDIGNENSSLKQENELFKEFEQNIAWRYCWLCDRIGLAVNEQIQLQNISIQKLKKKYESNNPLELLRNTILVSGNVNNTDLVSSFIEILRKEPFVKHISLLSAIKNRESSRLYFTIEILI